MTENPTLHNHRFECPGPHYHSRYTKIRTFKFAQKGESEMPYKWVLVTASGTCQGARKSLEGILRQAKIINTGTASTLKAGPRPLGTDSPTLPKPCPSLQPCISCSAVENVWQVFHHFKVVLRSLRLHCVWARDSVEFSVLLWRSMGGIVLGSLKNVVCSLEVLPPILSPRPTLTFLQTRPSCHVSIKSTFV